MPLDMYQSYIHSKIIIGRLIKTLFEIPATQTGVNSVPNHIYWSLYLSNIFNTRELLITLLFQ